YPCGRHAEKPEGFPLRLFQSGRVTVSDLEVAVQTNLRVLFGVLAFVLRCALGVAREVDALAARSFDEAVGGRVVQVVLYPQRVGIAGDAQARCLAGSGRRTAGIIVF